MVSPHGIQLAVHIVSSFYGELCSKVCECLLRRGNLTLAQIIRFTELSRENVINCLRVLIHQNCVQAYAIQQEGAFQEAPKIFTNYMALFDNMIHKMRAPKFLQMSEDLDKDCLEVFQGLIQHGRLSINQIIDRNEQTTGSADVHAVRECFSKLLAARFVERCPAPEPFLAPPSEEEAAAAKKRSKSTKISEVQTTEHRVLEAAAPVESRRFWMEMEDRSADAIEGSASNVKVGKKRKQDVLRSREDVSDANKEKEVLWRVNYEELVCRLKHKACVSYVKTKINDEAAIVLTAMLKLSKNSGDARERANKSASLSINAIYDEVIKSDDGLGMDFERIRAALEQLGCQDSPTDVEENYTVDIKSITEMAQNEEVESLMSRRYGKEAYKIFRLLSKADHVLETEKIADATFVDRKVAPKILHRLWKDDFLHMEKIASTGGKMFVFRLWKINKQHLQEQFLDEMYHAALNLRLRIAHELDKDKEVLQLPRDKLDGERKKKYNMLTKKKVILETSLMNLDDAILLFS